MAKATTARRQKPKAEIISINSLRARRLARRADVSCRLLVIQGDIKVGEVALCILKDGDYLLGHVRSCEDGLWQVQHERSDELMGVIGRVVHVEAAHVEESEGA